MTDLDKVLAEMPGRAWKHTDGPRTNAHPLGTKWLWETARDKAAPEQS